MFINNASNNNIKEFRRHVFQKDAYFVDNLTDPKICYAMKIENRRLVLVSEKDHLFEKITNGVHFKLLWIYALC